MKNTTTADLRERYRAFRKASASVATFCALLGTDAFTLERVGILPRYKCFQLPKNENGAVRDIEDPPPTLKKVQSVLNYYLQSVYYHEKSYAGYGFVVNAVTDEDKRNILTNARKHLKKKYLLQLDLKEFFHYVTEDMVREIFEAPPLCFKESLVDLLVPICTYQGRLPMGAPTSPVLSNLACRALDEVLIEMAEAKLWAYTRYADDLSFSANQPFAPEHIGAIRAAIESAGFRVNDQKTRNLGPDDPKVVTGILLEGRGALQPGFMEDTRAELERMATVLRAQHYHGELRTHWTEKMKQQVRGKIAFIGFVLGVQHPEYINIRGEFYAACAPPEEEFGAVSWKGFNYLT